MTPKLKAKSFLLPLFLAPALCEGDDEMENDEDREWLKKTNELIGPRKIVVSDMEAHFGTKCDIPGWTQMAMMANFTVLY